MSNKQQEETAITRFRAHAQVEVNAISVYATYTSGAYNAFYATEAEAIDHCLNPQSGVECNGYWIQDKYASLAPGELVAVVGNESVYFASDRSRHIEAVMSRHQIPFVEWGSDSLLVNN